MDLNDWKISRRSFIKWTAAAGAVLGLEGIVGKAHAKKHRILAKPKGLKSKEVLVFAQNVDSPEERYNIPTFSPGDELDLSQYLDFVDIKVPDPELGSRKDLKNHAYLQDILANEPTKGKITSEESSKLGYGTYSTWIAVYNGKKKRQEAVRLVFAVVPTDGALKELKSTLGLSGDYANLEQMMPSIKKAVAGLQKATEGKVDIGKFSGLQRKYDELAYNFARIGTVAKFGVGYDSFLGVQNETTKNNAVSTPGPQPLNAFELYKLAETLGKENIVKYLGIENPDSIIQESNGQIRPEVIKNFYEKACYNFFSLPPKLMNGFLASLPERRAIELLTFDMIRDPEKEKTFLKRVLEGEWIKEGPPTVDHESIDGEHKVMKVEDLAYALNEGEKNEKRYDSRSIFNGKGVKVDGLGEGPFLGTQLSIMPRYLSNRVKKQKYLLKVTAVYKKPGAVFGTSTVKKEPPVRSMTYDELVKLEEIAGGRRFNKDNVEVYLSNHEGKPRNYDGKTVAKFLASLPEVRAFQFLDVNHKYWREYPYKEGGKGKIDVKGKPGDAMSTIREIARLVDGHAEHEPKESKYYGNQYNQNWELIWYKIKVEENPVRTVAFYDNLQQSLTKLKNELGNNTFVQYLRKQA